MTQSTGYLLTDEELGELDQFLYQDDEATDMLSLDEAHGFTTAILIGAPHIDGAEWLTLIWGEPQFSDLAQAERLTDMLTKMRTEIQQSLDSGEPFEPLSVEEEVDGESYENFEGWCFGFMLGLSHLESSWHMGEKERELIAPIATLAMLYTEEQEELDEEEYEQCLELLPGAVSSLYRMSRNLHN